MIDTSMLQVSDDEQKARAKEKAIRLADLLEKRVARSVDIGTVIHPFNIFTLSAKKRDNGEVRLYGISTTDAKGNEQSVVMTKDGVDYLVENLLALVQLYEPDLRSS